MPGMLYNQQRSLTSTCYHDVSTRKNLDKAKVPELNPRGHKSCKPCQSPLEWLFKPKEAEGKSINGSLHGDDEERDNDLEDMVHDFMENGSSAANLNDRSTDSRSPFAAKICDKLQVISEAASLNEKELLYYITTLVMATNETDLTCKMSQNGCTNSFVIKNLRKMDYNASICRTKWQSSAKGPGGEYEFIEVIMGKERLIVDLEFRCQFEIARPSQNYEAAMKMLPLIFVGRVGKLERILITMSEAVESSMKQNLLHVPPWRTLGYMKSKWLYDREIVAGEGGKVAGGSLPHKCQCRGQFNRLKASLKLETEEEPVLKTITNAWKKK